MQTVQRSYRSSTSPDALNLHLHPKQWEAFETTATECLYGGAAGGGKSHLMRIAAVVWCSSIPGLQVYLFRRIRDDLNKNHMEGPKGFRAMLASWVNQGWCTIVEDEIRFWNGAKIYLCHCKDEKDIYKYQGAEIHVLLIDELTHFTESMYRFLRNRVRMVGVTIPPQYVGQFPRILCGANPGNVGHLWVKATFVSSGIPMEKRLTAAGEGGMIRQYIPARLEDNPSMTVDDPGYEMRLEGLGSAALVQAMRWGDWDVIEGAFFDCWDYKRHVVKPFEVPKDWARFRSGDWGSAKPFSFGWWAVVTDRYRTEQGVILPRGCIVRYREWYGMQPGKPNVGLKMHAELVGAGLAQKEKGDKVEYGVLDPAAFSEDGGPSIHERIMKGSGANGKGGYNVMFRRADNKRTPGRGAMGGWDQMRGRFVGDEDGNPMIAFFSTCTDSIRTIPALQHDPLKPEDLDSDMEDHCFCGDTLVSTSNGVYSIADLVGSEGKVWSDDGQLHRYRSARLTRANSPIVALQFSDGSEVRCTPDHRFLTTLGWVEAQYLSSFTLKPSKSSVAFASTNAAHTFSERAFGFIASCGKFVTGLSRKAITSITTTLTSRTTSPAICSASPASITSPCTDMIGRKKPERSLSAFVTSPRNGTAAIWARNGIESTTGFISPASGMPRSILSASSVEKSRLSERAVYFAPTLASQLGAAMQALITKLGLARSVGANSKQIDTPRSKHARESVEQQQAPERGLVCLSVKDAGRSDVYCLTVPDTGNFVLANGAVVSNCGDDTRYACMSRPWARMIEQDEKPKNRSGFSSMKSQSSGSLKVL